MEPTTTYGYACGAREALMQHAARSDAAKTPHEVAKLTLAARRIALIAGRPVALPQKAQD